jgi:hypothetical protein
MPLSTPISTVLSIGIITSAWWRRNGPPPARKVAVWTAAQKRPIRSLVRFFRAACRRRVPSYAAAGQLPIDRSRTHASSRCSSETPGRYHPRTVAHTASVSRLLRSIRPPTTPSSTSWTE